LSLNRLSRGQTKIETREGEKVPRGVKEGFLQPSGIQKTGQKRDRCYRKKKETGGGCLEGGCKKEEMWSIGRTLALQQSARGNRPDYRPRRVGTRWEREKLK